MGHTPIAQDGHAAMEQEDEVAVRVRVRVRGECRGGGKLKVRG